MFLQRLPFARTAAGVMIALAFTVAPAYAGHGGGGGGGHGGGGGGHGGGGGGYHGGGYGGYGGYGRGGYGGYGGYGRGFGYGGFGLGYGLGYYGGGYGYDDYPSYGTTYSGYYNPDVQYAQPTLNVTPSVNYDQGAADARAHITVQVPDPSAQVFFDGDATRQRGNERVFVTPPLAPGGNFHYTIEAKWMENGQEMSKTRTITVNPGGSATVIF
jgi:uncharacterized protein (TIGR03000 family)